MRRDFRTHVLSVLDLKLARAWGVGGVNGAHARSMNTHLRYAVFTAAISKVCRGAIPPPSSQTSTWVGASPFVVAVVHNGPGPTTIVVVVLIVVKHALPLETFVRGCFDENSRSGRKENHAETEQPLFLLPFQLCQCLRFRGPHGGDNINRNSWRINRNSWRIRR